MKRLLPVKPISVVFLEEFNKFRKQYGWPKRCWMGRDHWPAFLHENQFIADREGDWNIYGLKIEVCGGDHIGFAG